MALELKIGTVKDTTDPTNTGMLTVDIGFGTAENTVQAHYVSPYGSSQAAMVALPPVGAQVLLLRDNTALVTPAAPAGYYYLGSVLDGGTSMQGHGLPTSELLAEEDEAPASYTPSNKPGMNGPVGTTTIPDPATGLPSGNGL